MNEVLTLQAWAYLQEELSEPERAAFEEQMRADPAVAAVVKAVADSWAAAILSPPPSAAGRHRRRFRAAGHFLWPAAVAVLLGFNFWQWRHPVKKIVILHGEPAEPRRVVYAEPAMAIRPTGGQATPVTAMVVPVMVVNLATVTIAPKAPEGPSASASFDAAQRRGFLELRRLPRLGADRVLVLWVQPRDGAAYRPVGPIPRQFYGGGGSIAYTDPILDAPPARILITDEPASGHGARPGNRVILHGP